MFAYLLTRIPIKLAIYSLSSSVSPSGGRCLAHIIFATLGSLTFLTVALGPLVFDIILAETIWIWLPYSQHIMYAR